MLTDQAGWVAVAAVVLVVAVAVAVTLAAAGGPQWSAGPGRRLGRRRPPREHFRPEDGGADPAPRHVPAIVANPSKLDDVPAVHERAVQVCRELGWADPLWLETTVEDPGAGQARQAVDDGAAIVCAFGGDGTVRAVASALVGTEVPMGLLPGGTGNLLARNLQLPVDSMENALAVALSGQNKRVDVGRVSLVQHGATRDHVFLVMAGLGFDAAVMAGVPEELKRRIGYAAYSVSGLRHLRGPQFKVRVSVDGDLPFTRRVRTVVVGNCGKLQGGLVLLPEAEVDDGWLDAVLLSPQGLVGWLAVAVRILTRTRKGHERVDHRRARSIRVEADRPEQVQLDGDPVGPAEQVTVTVDPHALIVRVG